MEQYSAKTWPKLESFNDPNELRDVFYDNFKYYFNVAFSKRKFYQIISMQKRYLWEQIKSIKSKNQTENPEKRTI